MIQVDKNGYAPKSGPHAGPLCQRPGCVRRRLAAVPWADWGRLFSRDHPHQLVGETPARGLAIGQGFNEREKGYFTDATNEHDVFTGVWSLAQIRQVHEYLAQRSPGTRLVIGGWGGGPQLPPVLRGLDRALPTNIVFSWAWRLDNDWRMATVTGSDAESVPTVQLPVRGPDFAGRIAQLGSINRFLSGAQDDHDCGTAPSGSGYDPDLER